MFSRLEKMLPQIKSIILNDKVVRKLLYHDSNNAYNMDTPAIEDVEDYVTLRPIYTLDGHGKYEQNGMINIYWAKVPRDDYDSVTIMGILRVGIIFNVDKWELTGGRIRPLMIANRIVGLLDGNILETSNPMKFHSMEETIINKNLVGYTLLFSTTDGSSETQDY